MKQLALLFAVLLLALPARAADDRPSADTVNAWIEDWTGDHTGRLRPWAEAMADVCTSRAECMHLAAQGFVETRYAAWVLDQRCNDPAWRFAQRGWVRLSCDSGLSYGPWQLHDDRFRGASPALQASYALETLRHRPQAWTTWRAARSHAAWALAKQPASR